MNVLGFGTKWNGFMDKIKGVLEFINSYKSALKSTITPNEINKTLLKHNEKEIDIIDPNKPSNFEQAFFTLSTSSPAIVNWWNNFSESVRKTKTFNKQSIMNKKIQTISFQGIEGANSHLACKKIFPK